MTRREPLILAAWFAATLVVCALVLPHCAQAHLAYQPKCKSLDCIERSQQRNLAHAEYVAHHGAHAHRRWARKAVVWLARELGQTSAWLHPPAPRVVYGGPANVIAAAEYIAAQGGDPWPSCRDPYDGSGGTWQDTKDCESRGYSWYEDPPGYYCGPLQLDPNVWASVIRRYGIPC